MEEKTYIVRWERTATKWALWVKGRPQWRASHADRSSADEQLELLIIDKGGAMHPVFEYEPPLPLPAEEVDLGVPEIYLVGAGNHRFDANGPDPALAPAHQDAKAYSDWCNSFFRSPVCRVCGHRRRRRTKRALVVTDIDPGADGAFGHVGNRADCTFEILSEEFLSLLSPQERQGLQFREIERAGKRRGSPARRFFELLGPMEIESVAIDGKDVNGWQCASCGYRAFGCGGAFGCYVAASDLPSPVPDMFTIDDSGWLKLAVTGSRWRQLKGRKGTRGLGATRVGVAPDSLVVRQPELPTPEESRRATERKFRAAMKAMKR